MVFLPQTKIKFKKKHLQSLTHNKFEKCIRRKYNIQNPDFFDKDEIFNAYFHCHNKKFELYLDKYDFKLIFDKEFSPPIKSETKNNLTDIHLEKILLL